MALGILLSVCLALVSSVPIQVTTPNGIIQGEGDANQVFASFKGIPYAEPPARWTNPMPKAGWAPHVLQATQFGAACMQDMNQLSHNPGLSTSEDCLFLNVWTPYEAAEDPSAFNYPVMVFIHGGGFVSGTGADPVFWGNLLVNRTGVVLVTINYRLGVWGFLSGSTTYAPRGNFGLRDQQMALSWVQENIASFGGNPQQVTIFGQSAGGMSVGLHLVVPSSFQYYVRAIAESNPASLMFRTLEDNDIYFEAIVRDSLCGNATSPNVMTCLRAVSTSWLLEVQTVPEYLWTFRLPFRSIEGLDWEPVIDGDLLPDQPVTLIVNGKHNVNAKVIFGTVKNETNGFFTFLKSMSALEYEIMMKGIFAANASTILKQYPPLGSNSLAQANFLLTDYLFVCPVRYISRYYEQYAVQDDSVFLYNFLYTPAKDPENPSAGCQNAACHSVELQFVFDSRTLVPGNNTFSHQEQWLSNMISEFWTSFAAVGVPSTESFGQNGPMTWPAFTSDNDLSMGLNTDSIMPFSGYDNSNCDFWDQIGYIY